MSYHRMFHFNCKEFVSPKEMKNLCDRISHSVFYPPIDVNKGQSNLMTQCLLINYFAYNMLSKQKPNPSNDTVPFNQLCCLQYVIERKKLNVTEPKLTNFLILQKYF